MQAPGPDALRYLDQVVEPFDPDMGLSLPEQLAALVSLDLLPATQAIDDPGALWRRSLAALLRDPAAPRLRTLLLADWSDAAPDPWDVDHDSSDPTPLMRRLGARLVALERLYIGPWPPGVPEGGVCQGLGPTLTGLPALRRLHMVGERGWMLLPSAGHPRLHHLIVHVPDPDDGDELVAALCGAPFPALAELDLWNCHDLAEALADGSFAAGLDRLTDLRRLTLRGLDDPAALTGLLAANALAGLTALAVLDAPRLDDAALTPLLDAPWLPRLDALDLRGTAVSPALAAALRARGPAVQA